MGYGTRRKGEFKEGVCLWEVVGGRRRQDDGGRGGSHTFARPAAVCSMLVSRRRVMRVIKLQVKEN